MVTTTTTTTRPCHESSATWQGCSVRGRRCRREAGGGRVLMVVVDVDVNLDRHDERVLWRFGAWQHD